MHNRTDLPYGTLIVGILGAGQLSRMMAESASQLGIQVKIYATSNTESAALLVADTTVGDLTDLKSVLAFGQTVDVITLDHELVPKETLDYLVSHGVVVYPNPKANIYAANKSAMRMRLADISAPIPQWLNAENLQDAENFANEVGYPFIAKSPTGGYDGRGVWQVRIQAELSELKFPVLLEEKISFIRELSALVVRSPHNQAVCYPIVETVQQDGICVQVIAPAQNLNPERASEAQQLALKIAAELDVIGVMAVELFDTGNGPLLINELAMRPHNSGHWTQDGAITSQFENHLRAVLDLPLGLPNMTATYCVMGNILGGSHLDLHRGLLHCLARDPELQIHLYGKQVKPNRKVGHINLVGDDLESLRERVQHATDFLAGKIDE
ncbi:MAG: 5-(carboxyamino)imidazole ribonucleotide synthase [Actinobacteria bacterium]|nr:5-(carboxyamino)imidazole ribonucleotide synthase [Actinomycetota bacterium]